MAELISKEKVLWCLKASSEEIDWGQSEDGDAFKHYVGASYRTIAEFKPEQPQWISVKDRLPEVGKVVLAFGTRSATTGMFQGVSTRNDLWSWKGHTIKHVSHWMPLPEPPEVKQDD